MRRDDPRLLCSEVARRIDRITQERYGVPGELLMENAGQKAWAVVRDEIVPDHAGRSIVFVAGSGNNGGDALVMARQCSVEAAARVTVVTVKAELRGAAAEQWRRLESLGTVRIVWETETDPAGEAIDNADIIIDGINGTGLTGPLREPAAALVNRINRSSAMRIAIDIPSGMRDGGDLDDPHVVADHTVFTGHRKRLAYAPARRRDVGEVHWVDPGFPPPAIVDAIAEQRATALAAEPDDAAPTAEPHDAAPVTGVAHLVDHDARLDAIRRRRNGMPDAHKGIRGRVAIIAGGEGTEGAALLCGAAASSAGAGMVRVWTNETARRAGIARHPGIMWRTGLPGADEAAWADVFAVGPGWTDADSEAFARIMELAGEQGIPTVIDASALRYVASFGASLSPSEQRGQTRRAADGVPAPIILTPHPGEMARIIGASVDEVVSRPFEALDTAAQIVAGDIPVIIVLKGAATILRRSGGAFEVLDGRCMALGVAGSGDVLTGIIAAHVGVAARTEAVGTTNPEAIEAAVLNALVEHLQRGRRLFEIEGFFSADELSTTGIIP